MISPLAAVGSARIDPSATIREFSVVEDGVVIGPGCVVHPHTVVATGTVLGAEVEVFPGAFVGKEPKGAGATLRPITFTRSVRIGDHASIGPGAVIYYDVEIGSNSLIGDSASIREGCRIGARSIISRCVTINYQTTIGDECKVMDNTHITGKCRIGNRVFIGVGVMTTNDNVVSNRSQSFAEDELRGVVVDDDAVIASGVTVLPNVHIHAHAFVGAGALVTRDVAAGVTVLGVPARPRV